MNNATMGGFNPITPQPKFESLRELVKPTLPALANFIHCCSPDLAARTNAVTQFIMSICQLAGRQITPRLPSVITVTPDGLPIDSGDQLACMLLSSAASGEPKMHKDGPSAFMEPEHAPGAMTNALAGKKDEDKSPNFKRNHIYSNEQLYFAAQRTGFGYGPVRPYSEAWNTNFQLITDQDTDEIILRLKDQKDRDALRKDITNMSSRLRQPYGYGAGLKLVPKYIALSGSVLSSEWDRKFAEGLINLGIPLLMLPSSSQSSLDLTNQRALKLLTSPIFRSYVTPIEEPANLIPNAWFEIYSRELRARLHRLPCAYEYTILKMARQLFPICLQIVNLCGTQSGASTQEIIALTHDLCQNGMRGLVLSIAGLAWHGLGIEAGCSPSKIPQVLDYLRARKPMTKSALLRGAHLKKEERDRIVEVLEKENLICINDNVITATNYSEFAKSLHSRTNLPEPRNNWAKVSKSSQAKS